MSDLILPGQPPVSVRLRRNAAARRLSLRVSRLDGRVTLTLPTSVQAKEAMAFAQQKSEWIRAQLAERRADVLVRSGAVVMIQGRQYQVLFGPGRRVIFDEKGVLVPGPPDQVGRRLAAHLREMARDRLRESSDRYAQQLGHGYSRMVLRDTRSRWGSCSSDGRLMYSWRLILAPPEVLDYVAAHEVAHLCQMNHSPAFWAIVRDLYGDWRAPRKWLHDFGADLHRIRFD
jgi:predicted metal-dependent hydrolase